MRISDWSSDVCSSDLAEDPFAIRYLRGEVVAALAGGGAEREVAAEAALHGVLEVGPVAEVLTDEGEVACPVAGGEGRALGVHEIGILGAGQDVHRLGQPDRKSTRLNSSN